MDEPIPLEIWEAAIAEEREALERDRAMLLTLVDDEEPGTYNRPVLAAAPDPKQ